MAELNIRVNVDRDGSGAAGARRVAGEVGGLRTKAEETTGVLARMQHGLTRFGLAAAGIGAAVNAFRSLGEAMAEAERHATAVRNLGGAYGQVEAATRGAVRAEDAYRVQQSFVQAGINVTSDQLAAITRRAREYALATGTDARQALEQLTEALRNGEAGGLRRYGVAVAEGANRMTTFRNVTEQWITTQRGVEPQANTASESLGRMGRQLREIETFWLNAANAVGRYIERALSVPEPNIRNEEERIRVEDRARLLRLRTERGTLDVYAQEGAEVRQQQEEARRERDLLRLQNEALDRAFAPGAQDRTRPDRGGGGGGGGGGGADASHLWQQIAEATTQISYAGVDLELDVDEEIRRHPGERLAAYHARLQRLAQFLQGPAEVSRAARGRQRERAVARQTAMGEEIQRADEQRRITGERRMVTAGFEQTQRRLAERTAELSPEGQQIVERQRERGEEVTDQSIRNARRLTDTGAQLRDRFRSIFGETQTMAQRAAGIVGGAFETMTGSFRSHLGALITGRETIGEALRGIVHETLLNLATESAVKALFETAQGFAALATYQFAPAGQHFIAAGMYTGVAALAGIGAAISAPSAANAPSSAAGSGIAPSSPRIGGAQAGGEGGGNVTYVMNFQSALVTREDAQDTLRRASNGAFARNVRSEEFAQLQRARVR